MSELNFYSLLDQYSESDDKWKEFILSLMSLSELRAFIDVLIIFNVLRNTDKINCLECGK